MREGAGTETERDVGVLAYNRECCAQACCLNSYLQPLQHAQSVK